MNQLPNSIREFDFLETHFQATGSVKRHFQELHLFDFESLHEKFFTLSKPINRTPKYLENRCFYQPKLVISNQSNKKFVRANTCYYFIILKHLLRTELYGDHAALKKLILEVSRLSLLLLRAFLRYHYLHLYTVASPLEGSCKCCFHPWRKLQRLIYIREVDCVIFEPVKK